MTSNADDKSHANLDPITGEPGAHPIGVGLGATAGGVVTGAAAGTLAAGPIGTAVGAAIGAVVGGLGGKAVAEHFDPTGDADHWRANHAKQPYYVEGHEYDAYEPAYRVGGQPRERYANKTFDEVEPALAQEYSSLQGEAHVKWDQAKHAARAAWDRVTHSTSS